MVNGFVVGIVLDNKDPSGMHRVLVQFPVEEKVESYWARQATPMAGQGRGLVMLPEIGTEVVLAFMYRTLEPVIIGAVYNGKDDKPKPYANEDGENNHRVFESRNGHRLDFDDTDGAEKIILTSLKESPVLTATIETPEKKTTLHSEQDIKIDAVEKIVLTAKDIELTASNSMKLSAITLESRTSTSTSISGGTSTTLDAAVITLN